MIEKKFIKIIVEWFKWIVLGVYGYVILIVDVVLDLNVCWFMNEINVFKFMYVCFLFFNIFLGCVVL